MTMSLKSFGISLFGLGCAAFLSSCAFASLASDDEIALAEKHIRLGVLALRQGSKAEASAQFLLSQEFAILPESYDGFGVLALLEDDLERALHFFLLAQSLDRKYAPAFAHEALVRERLGELAQAEDLYRYALELDPGDEAVRNDYAIFLASQKGNQANKDARRNKGNWELRKAYALSPHPIISSNLQRYGLQ
jgi:Flp pilus assembly protein TadD